VSDEQDLPETTDSEQTAMSTDYSRALGARLRAIRNQQGLSLQGVEDKSHGRWKAVVVGSYERGDRAVTVQRLSELAVFYGVPVSELLPDPRPSSAVTTNTKIVLNLESLGSLPADEAGPLARYASTIQAQRHDYNGKVLSIRTEDLKSLAIIYDMSPDELTSRLIEWGVLSPGMDAILDMGPDDDADDELDPHWERRRSPR
jgi:transcriptional regulator with XRE-family HTH domain